MAEAVQMYSIGWQNIQPSIGPPSVLIRLKFALWLSVLLIGDLFLVRTTLSRANQSRVTICH